jgi:hypothetical protein
MDLSDDGDSDIFDDFQDEYPFEINSPPDHLNDINNMSGDEDNNDQMDSLDSNNAIAREAEATKILEEFCLESFSKVKL